MNQEDSSPKPNPKSLRSKILPAIFVVVALGIFIGNFVASGRLQRILDSENPAKAALLPLAISAIAGFLLLKSEKRFPNLNPIFVLFGVCAGALVLILRVLS